MENKKYLLLVLFIAGLFTLWNITEGELIGPDTCQHAITGIFISDFLKDLVFLKSFQEIWNYTWTYYAHYPAVGLLHWPPLFHFIEGIYLLIVDISATSLRVLILSFFILGIIYYYLLISRLFNNHIAMLSSILFITSPLVLVYARMVSLEIPALTVCLIAIYFFHNYTQTYRTSAGVYASIFTVLALLTKQNAIFLVVFYTLYYFSGYFDRNRGGKVVNYRQLLLFIGIIILFTVPYYLITLYLHGGTILKDVFQGTVFHNPFLSWDNYVYYIFSINNQVSIITIILLLIFIVFVLLQFIKINYPTKFLLLWALSCYITFTLIAQKDVRYIIYWIPALTGLAGLALKELIQLISHKWKINPKTITLSVMGFIVLGTTIQGIARKQPVTKGYDEIAQYILSSMVDNKSEILFYDGNDYGFITFSLRKNDPRRRTFLFRSSKYLYATNIFSEYETWNVRTGKNEIINFFKKYGIRYIILSFTTESHIPAIQFLRELVAEDDDFILLKNFFVINGFGGKGNIAVYYYKGAQPLSPGTELEIPMPTLGKTIKIRLD